MAGCTNENWTLQDLSTALQDMGFTDDFKQVVSNTQMYRQAGHSVVVDVFMALIKEIIKCI